MNRDVAKEIFNFSDLKSISEEDIESQYRNLVKEKHPDVGGSEDEFKQLKEAKNVLLRAVNSKSTTTAQNTSNYSTKSTQNEQKTDNSTGFTNPYRNTNNSKQNNTTSTSNNTTSNNTTSKTSTSTKNNLSGKDYVINESNSHFLTHIKKFRQFISSIIGKFNIILFIFLFFLLLNTHNLYIPIVEQYITIPSQISLVFDNYTSIIQYVGYTVPAIIYFDLRYQQDNSRKLVEKFTPQVLMETIGFKKPLQYSKKYLLLIIILMIVSFGGLLPYIERNIPITTQTLYILYSFVIGLYLLIRYNIPSVNQFKIKYEEFLEE